MSNKAKLHYRITDNGTKFKILNEDKEVVCTGTAKNKRLALIKARVIMFQWEETDAEEQSGDDVWDTF